MPLKLPFSILACTGEDPECPARELLCHNQDSKGWCTPRNCAYPQELVLRLEAPARLTQIQLLCHESRIPAKVEILVGLVDPALVAASQAHGSELAAASWKRLGFLTCDSNERTAHSARELKTVGLPGAPAHLLRFLVHRCHANVLNPYNQAGLVALVLMGEPLAGPGSVAPLAPITNTPLASYGMAGPASMAPYAAALQLGATHQLAYPAVQQQQQPYMPPPGAAAAQPARSSGSGGGSASATQGAAALAAELGVDQVTAERIAELQAQKTAAVGREDYDEAKRLKAAVDRLRSVGSKIASLEGRKHAAVEAEDYDLAKELKAEIDRVRARAYAAALSGESSAGDVGGAGGAGFTSHRGNSTAGAASVEPSSVSAAVTAQQEIHWGSLQQQSSDSKATAAAPPAAPAALSPPAASGIDWSKYDDRPAVAKGTYDFAGADASTPPPGSRRGSAAGESISASAAVAAPRAPVGGPPPPAGFPSDLPPPDELSPTDAAAAAPAEALLGEYLARCLFSRAWQLREAALVRAAADMESSGSELAGRMDSDPGETFRALARLVARGLADKAVGVYAAALGLLHAAVNAAALRAGKLGPAGPSAVGELLPLLVEKGADLNGRIREQACEALNHLLGVHELGVRSQSQAFLRPFEPRIAFKKAAARLQLVATVLPSVGIATGGSSGEGFQLESVMAFAAPCFSHKEAVVRSSAVALTAALARAAGPGVQRLLPADLNPKLREQIQADILAAASGSAESGAAAVAAQPARAAKPAPAAAKAPVPKPAAAVAAPAAAAAPNSPGLLESPGSLLPGADDDPAPYQVELAAREVRLGPNHPDVAEALSNLAIIHNQRGDAAAALPLYERALGIWEAALGPDHPDVAHTLTDIAVIHLERGRDDLGRPLLERALAIQERHLGSDHPDVVAIRDVLAEEA